jgi:lysophospholipid acyltransferase (LPLAT)-like uncharacterized protein
MFTSKRILRKRWARKAIAFAGAEYLRLVFLTNRHAVAAEPLYARAEPDLPVILAMWHGQHFLAPFLRRPNDRAKVLISLHRDGEVNALAAERLGIEVIRGSGAPDGGFDRKGGVGAFREMLEALRDGYTVAVTADVPKVSRRAGLGLVKLASLSGRPIYPVAIATSRRIVLDNWDRTTISLPFGRLAVALGEPVRVDAEADEAALERARSAIEALLNDATARAHAIADGKSAGPSRDGHGSFR